MTDDQKTKIKRLSKRICKKNMSDKQKQKIKRLTKRIL